MNVEVENLPNCITTMRVEVPREKVEEVWNTVAKEYGQYARIPGYRPGKAPRSVVEAKYRKEIKEELTKKLLSQSCREAISEKKIRVLSLAEIEDVELDEQVKSMKFTATLVTAPEFDLPDYKNLPAPPVAAEVTDAEVEESVENLRSQAATFNDIEGRSLQMDDFAVIDYNGTIDGKPVHEVFPKTGKSLSTNSDFWIRLTPEAFFPGFADQLVGANLGETRTVQIEVPAEFAITDLAGQKISYEVTIKGLKEKVLPELNDEFAATIVSGKTLEEVREMARTELTRQKEWEAARDGRTAIMQHLLSQVECELPANLVKQETQRILAEMVRENQGRGVTDEVLKESEKDLVSAAGQSARERLKGTFVLLRIAEAEKLKVTREEFKQRIAQMAARYQTAEDKLLKELEKRGALDSVNEEILTGKTLDFITSGGNVDANSQTGVSA